MRLLILARTSTALKLDMDKLYIDMVTNPFTIPDAASSNLCQLNKPVNAFAVLSCKIRHLFYTHIYVGVKEMSYFTGKNCKCIRFKIMFFADVITHPCPNFNGALINRRWN